MAFSRYRAIADPFDAVPYKEILRKVIGFGIATLVTFLVAASIVVAHGHRVFKFNQLVIDSVWYNVPRLLIMAFLVSSLEHTWRTIKILKKADDTPAETRKQRRNGVKMVLVLIGAQTIQAVLESGNYLQFLYLNPYFAVTNACLFQCFQASYTAVVLIVMEKGTQSKVTSVKIPENTGVQGSVGPVVEMTELE
eukprot:sb/3470997/